MCTNWELFTGCREKPIYKEGTRRGGNSPATVPWKGVEAGEGACQQAGVRRGFLEPASTSNGSQGRRQSQVGSESQGQPRAPLLGPQPVVTGGRVESG